MRHSFQLDFEQRFESLIESLNDLKVGSTSQASVDIKSDNIDIDPQQILELSELGTKVSLPDIQTFIPTALFVPESSAQTSIPEQNVGTQSPNVLESGYCCLCTACGTGHSHGAKFQTGGTVAQFNDNNGRFKWDQPGGRGQAVDITYSFAPSFSLNGLTNNQAKSLFREALGVWAEAAPLNFREIQDPGNGRAVDIRVGADFIDGRSNTLAFAFFPQGGDQTYDNGDNWNASLFLETAVHETGHSLGLGHESGVDAIMNPSIQRRFNGAGSAFLLQDDINGIRSLYGSGTGSVSPISPSPAPTPAPTPAPSPSPTPGDNRIDGTNRNDVLRGGSRNDVIRGFAGNDLLSGRGGNDRLLAGTGNDRAFGGSGNDVISGDGGNDRMSGGSGNDRMFGGSGNDRMSGNSGNDLLKGGSGNDSLSGGDGRDRLIGVNTRDANPGVGEIDFLRGGRSADAFVLGDSQKVYYADGPATSNYAMVQDFTPNQGDVLQLNGTANDYSLGSSPQGLPSGTALVYEGGSSREIIAIIQGTTNFSLTSSAVRYV